MRRDAINEVGRPALSLYKQALCLLAFVGAAVSGCEGPLGNTTANSGYAPGIAQMAALEILGSGVDSAAVCSGPYKIEVLDNNGNTTATPSDLALSLSGAGAGVFYSDGSCAVPVPASFTMSALSSEYDFYYRDNSAQNNSFTVSGGGLTAGALDVAVVSSAANHLALIAGNSQTGSAGSLLPVSLKAQALDGSGNPVNGATLSWTVASGGGALSSSVTSTDSSGYTQVNWTLGNSPGAQTVTVQSAGTAFPGSPSSLTFTAAALTGSPDAGHSTISGTSPVLANGISTSTVTINLQDQFGNPIAGVTPTISVSGAGVSATPCSASSLSGVSTCSVTATSSGVDALALTSPLALSGGNITFQAAAASQLVFSAEPSGGTAGVAWTTQGTVKIEDAHGNVVTTGADSTAPITLTVASGSGALSGTVTVNAVAGVASFASSSLLMTSAGTKVIQAAKPDLTGSGGTAALTVNSTNVIITAAAESATKSSITASSGQVTADGSSKFTLTATVEDAYGNPIAGDNVALQATGAGNTLTQPTTTTNASGVTTASIASTASGAKTVSFTTPAALSSDSVSVTFSAGSAVAANSSITGTGPVVADGSSHSTVTITLADASGNGVVGVVPTFTATDTGSTNSYGACSATNGSGISTCTLMSSRAEAKTLSIATPVAKSGGSVTFTNGAATQIAWTTQPSGGTAGVAWSPQGIVTIKDAQGNAVTTGPDATAQISLSVSSGSGSISGTTSINAVAGVADFTGQGLSMTVAGSPVIRATKASTVGAGGVAALTADSSAISITAAGINAGQSSIVAGAASANADGATPVSITITVKDQYGNPISGQGASFSATGSGNTVVQPSSATAANGQAAGSIASTVAELKTLTVVTPVALTSLTTTVQFISTAVVAANSSITGSGPVIANGSATSTVTITLKDTSGNPVANATPSFGATDTGSTNAYGACSSSNGSGVSTCTLSSTVAEVKTLSITGPVSKSGGTVTFTNGPATQFLWTTQPSGGIAGTIWTTQGALTLEDAQGNIVTTGADATASISLSVSSGTGSLSGTASMNAAGGVANFAGKGLYMTAAGNKTLLATKVSTTGSGGVGQLTATSGTFGITASLTPSASQSTLSASPTSATADGTSSIAITGTVKDQYGNPVSGQNITLSDSGSSTTLTQPAASSDASGMFSASVVSTLAQTETISISSPASLSSVSTSVTFTAGAPVAANSTITGSGPVTANGSTTSTITITLIDHYLNPVPGVVPTFTATDTGSTNSYGACTSSNAAGVSTCSLSSSVAEVKTLSLLTPVSKSGGTVTFTNGSATQLVWSASPSGGSAGSPWTTQGTVTLEDAHGNVVATGADATASVALTIASGSGALLGTTSMNAVAGVANFSGKGLQINSAGAKTLLATKSAITATSSSFNVTPASASLLVVAGYPTPVTAGTSNSLTVTAQDSYGNTATAYAGTVQFTSSDSQAVLPANYAFQPGDNGVKSFSATLRTAGAQSITATDAITSSINGAQSAISVSAAAATKLAFTTQPGNGAGGGAFSTQPQLTVEDAYGNTITGSSASIALAIGTNPASGTLSGTSTLTAASGIASFSGLSINAAGTGYTLTATSVGLTSATSNAFNVTVGSAVKLAFTTQPGDGSGGLALSTQPQVTVQDAGGNTVGGSSALVALAIGTNPGSGTLSGTASVVASSGVSTFSGLSINSAGTGYTLTATSAGLTPATSASFNITVGAAAKLAFTAQPGNATGGAALSTQPQVTIEDAGGNTITGSSASVALAIGTNPASGTLSGTATQAAASGVSTFAGLSINAAGNGYTLIASSAGLTSATSSGFNITVGAAAKLAFTTQPSGGTGGTAWATQPQVTVEDAGGNVITGSSASVALVIGANPASGTLSGTASVAASSGVSTFSGLSINTVGSGYTLVASSAGLTSATSSNFNITLGAAAKLVFSVQPGDGMGGAALSTQPQVTVQDAGGNTVTGSSAQVALAIGTNPSSGTLSGTASIAASSGIAAFSALSINAAGTGYTLSASSAGLTSATSSTFNITVGGASKLVFSTQPGNGTGGLALSIQPQVTVQDAGGNTLTGSTASVALSIGNNPSTGTLSGTNPVAASSGVVSFSGLSINTAGTGYTLVASSAGLTSATSTAFNITVGSAAKLAFTTQPGSGTGGSALSTQPQITVQDAGGNTVTGSSANIALVIGTNPASGTLSGTASMAASSGVAAFSALSINNAGTGYTLSASSAGLTSATSSAFNITVGSAAKLAFTTQPGNGTGGSAFSTQPQITVQDAGGNTITGSSATVALTIGTNPATGTLSGTTSVSASSGVASYSGLSINNVGTGYTLTASSAGLTSATSSTFNITLGAASKLAFTTQPGNGTGGSALSTQPQITVQDAGGNTITGSSATVALAIGTNPASGTLSGTASVSASSGIATYSGLSINTAGTGYTLVASSAGLTPATSTGFNITVGAATKLAFTTQVPSASGGTAFATQPQVSVEDAGGNVVTGSTASVTLAIGTNPSAGTLSGTKTVNATSGVSGFSGLSINFAGVGYTLVASSGGLTSATGSAFTVSVGSATQLAFSTQPGGGTGGTAWAQQPIVLVEDAGGNQITSSSATIALSIGTNPASGTLSGTASLAATGGQASYAALSIDAAGSGYTLVASSAGLTPATSTAFNITVGSASKLAFTAQPGGGTGGVSWTNQPQVTVEDAGGNTISGSSATVALAIGTNPSSGMLSGTTSLAASSGVSTFSGLSINTVGTGYTLVATSAGLTSATSSAFNVAVGAATKIAFTTQPGGGAGGAAWTTQPVITVQDAGGNTVTGSSASVALSIGTNPASGTLSGTSTLAASSGVSSFTGLSINAAGNGYTLFATSSGLTAATSSTFNITVGSASRLAFTTQPSGGTGGAAWTTQPVVTVQDAGGNTITGSSASIALAIGTNPASGTLSGTATVAASSGVSTFSGLSINAAGMGYTIVASSSGLTSATSSNFNITVGTATKLAFTTQVPSAYGGTAFATQPQVSVEDAGGNVVTGSSASITLAIGTNPSVGTLSGTKIISASSGVGIYSGLSINAAGAGYTLVATSTGLTSATSASFNVNIGAAAQLAYGTQPGGGTGGTAWGTQPIVLIEDAGGNQVISSTATIAVAIGTNPSSGTLSGTASVAATGGQVNYSGLSINKSGTGYTLVATSSGLTSATSSAFNITVGSAYQLGFTTQPGGGTGGLAWTTQPSVSVQDAGGNTVTGSSASVALVIGTNPASGTLSGTATVSASSGVAGFTGLSINTAGTGYTLTASSSGLVSSTSSAFNITVGAAAKLAFTTQVSGATGGSTFTTQPKVSVEDAGGNVVTSATNSVTVAILTNPSSGTLSGSTPTAAVSGVTTFSGLSINLIGTGYTLQATATGLTSATSSAFNVTVGSAYQLGFTTQPGGGTGGVAWTTQPSVSVQDAGGNTVTGSSASIALVIGTNPAAGTLAGTATHAASSGVSTFSGLSINTAGTGYTLTASSSGLVSGTSSAFNITVGPATQLVFTTQPGGGVGGKIWMNEPVVAVQDAGGNTVTSSAASITLAIGTNPAAGTLSGTKTQTATSGVDTSTDLSINTDGTGYTLVATSTGLTSATSNAFNIATYGTPAIALTTAAMVNNGNTVTYSGTCTAGYIVTVSGQQSASFLCGSGGTWSWTSSAVSPDGNYTFNFSQTSGSNTSTASGTYDRDTTAPTAVASFVDGNYTTSAATSPLMTWNATTDPGTGASGISYYMIAIGTTAGGTDVQAYTNVGNVTAYTASGLTLTDGVMYYGSIKAVDNAGNSSTVTQGDGFAVVTDTATLNLSFLGSSTPLTSTNTSTPAMVQFSNVASSASSSTPMYYNSTGSLTAAPENLLLYSQAFNNTSGWTRNDVLAFGSGSSVTATTAPDGTMTGALITEDTTANPHSISSANVAYTAGSTVTVSVYAKYYANRNFRLRVASASNEVTSAVFNPQTYAIVGACSGAVATATCSIQQVSNGWARYSISAVISNTSTAINVTLADMNASNYSYTGDGTSGVYYWGAQIEAGSTPSNYIYTTTYPAYGPRLDYSPTSVGSLNGLLIEESRTNGIRNNTMQGAAVGTLPTNWSIQDVAGVTVSVVAIGTEEGISYVDLNVAGTPTTTGTGYVAFEGTNVIAASSGQIWTTSVYTKLSAGSLTHTTIAGQVQYYNSSGTSVGNVGLGVTPTSANLSTQRLSAAATISVATTAYIRSVAAWTLTNGQAVNFTLRLGMPQLEQGAMATSVIPTSGTALTRSADVATVNTPAILTAAASAGTLVTSAMSGSLVDNSTVAITQIASSLESSAAPGRIQLRKSPSTSTGDGKPNQAYVNNATVNQTGAGANGSWGVLAVLTQAEAYQNNDFASAYSGTLGTTSSSGSLFTPTQLVLGYSNIFGSYFNGWLQSVQFYSSRLTNPAIQELTHP